LLTKLLSPDTKERIKVRDIFYHPWVRSFENKYKEEKHKEEKLKTAKTNVEKSRFTAVDSDKENFSLDLNHCITNKISPKIVKKGVKSVKKLEKEIENITKKIEGISPKINDKAQEIKNKEVDNDYSLFNENQIDNENKDNNLFNRVLDQVKVKNTIKKKNKIQTPHIPPQKEDSNKMILVEKKESSYDIQELVDNQNFSLLEELNSIDYKINQLEKDKEIYEEKINTKMKKKDHNETYNNDCNQFSNEFSILEDDDILGLCKQKKKMSVYDKKPKERGSNNRCNSENNAQVLNKEKIYQGKEVNAIKERNNDNNISVDIMKSLETNENSQRSAKKTKEPSIKQ